MTTPQWTDTCLCGRLMAIASYFDPADLHHLPKRLEEAGAQGVFTLLNLDDVERYVGERLAITA